MSSEKNEISSKLNNNFLWGKGSYPFAKQHWNILGVLSKNQIRSLQIINKNKISGLLFDAMHWRMVLVDVLVATIPT